ncbi:hypothetical protein COU17_03295 [Candidatus Kaiserbacteria bacterium CG10_big_fil_rev_8_21_14_0_10_49_17]|uniref:NlpC/P60 domain-containing protein n=1 Tax=Candidatus Kaiserbacteria bacterium CG10_big_fil_rev_8_21_14_0_10_49_17 TaxID=1974609 RepID=A0A2M6WDR9_9BACT|nr:MAG: hypothetical protein COU17_03295 [Candidatus Kaiserbacteria bacterium CG10_big_fil_rev_8_21_14_0_10_49_17]
MAQTVEIQLFPSYIATIKNSIGSNMFRNLYAKVDGVETDILRDGDRSCALFVSAILHQFKLLQEPHSTVAGLVRDMERSGWEKIKSPKEGAVLVWVEEEQASGERHPHAGFSVGGEEAISNSWQQKQPVVHHETYGEENGEPVRKIETIYWHPKLNG